MFVSVLILLGVSSSTGDEKTLAVARGQASVTVPADWTALDPRRVEVAALLGGQSGPAVASPNWTDALRPVRHGQEQTFPTVLVELHDTGRVPWPVFWKHVRDFEEQSYLETSGGGPLVGQPTEASMEFDPGRLRLHSQRTFGNSAMGPLIVRSVTVLTERGTVTVHGLARAGIAPNELRLADEVVHSLEVAPEFAYRRTLGDLFLLPDLVDWRIRLAVAGLLVACSALLLLRVQRVRVRRRT